jgi:hypothetical protein
VRGSHGSACERNFRIQHHAREQRNDGERQQQRAGQREHDGQRHRREQLAFQPLQAQQRHEYQRDDDDAGGGRHRHLAHRLEHHVLPRTLPAAPGSCRWATTFSTTTTAASTSRPMAIASPPRLIRLADSPAKSHQQEGPQRGQRQHHCHGQRGAQIAEEQIEQDAAPAPPLRCSALVTVPTALDTSSPRS